MASVAVNAYHMPQDFDCFHGRVVERSRITSSDQVITGIPCDSMHNQQIFPPIHDNLTRQQIAGVAMLHRHDITRPDSGQHTCPVNSEACHAGAASQIECQFATRRAELCPTIHALSLSTRSFG